MPSQLLNLLLIALFAQSVLGGFGVGTKVCLGGVQHVCESVPAHDACCTSSCAHESGWPTPTDDHEGCGCIDVTLATVEQHASVRLDDGLCVVMAFVPTEPDDLRSRLALLTVPERGPPGWVWRDHALRESIVRLASTRLNI